MIQAREYDYKYYFEGTDKLEHIKLKVKKSEPVGVQNPTGPDFFTFTCQCLQNNIN